MSPNHLTYLERLRLTWSFTWPLLLVDVAWAVALFAAGESDSDIAEDFGIAKGEVKEALKFEGVRGGRRKSRLH